MKTIYLMISLVLVSNWNALSQSDIDVTGDIILRSQPNFIRAQLSATDGSLKLFTSPGALGAELGENTWEAYNQNNVKTVMINSSNTGNASLVELYDNDGQTKIRIDANGTGNGGYMDIMDDAGNQRIRLFGEESNGNGSAIYLYDRTGSKTIELDADFNGKGRVITDELQIVGGSDLVENFDINLESHPAIPGAVVSIDPDVPGRLNISSKAYDKRVAGVISGANGLRPGLLMGQKESLADGDFPVALIGRVYVLADAGYGKINPGDLLTSSDTPGHAMKVKKYRKGKGAIIGKAMTSLHTGKGFVLTLINLQ